MLLFILLQIPIMFISVLTSLFPKVTSLPFGIDTYLVTGFSNFLFVAALIPPLYVMYQAFLWVIAWKLGLQLFRIIPFIGKLIR